MAAQYNDEASLCNRTRAGSRENVSLGVRTVRCAIGGRQLGADGLLLRSSKPKLNDNFFEPEEPLWHSGISMHFY